MIIVHGDKKYEAKSVQDCSTIAKEMEKNTETKQLARYEEDGYEAIVEILEDNSDEEFERYKLKALKVIRPAFHGGIIEKGKEFEVDRDKKYAKCYSIWSLKKI